MKSCARIATLRYIMTNLELYNTIRDFYKEVGFECGIDWVQTHEVLINLAKEIQPQRYGEIGSHVGCSMSYVALSCPNTELFSYDYPNAGWGGQSGTEGFLKKAMERFANGRSHLNFGNSQSNEIKNKIKENAPYDLFMIDGDHSSEGCKIDFETVLPNMATGGVIVIDDLIHHRNLETLFDEIIEKFNFKSEKFMETQSSLTRGVGVIYL